MLRHIYIFTVFFVLSVFSLNVVKPGPQYPPTKGEVWPKPQYQKKENKYYKFIPSEFKIKISSETCEILRNAVERYAFILRDTHRIAKRNVHPEQTLNLSQVRPQDENFESLLTELQVELSMPCEDLPYFGMVESYNLTVASVSILKSTSIWGILRGLETWVQLFYFSNDYKEMRINKTDIVDFPRYPHRGLLIDTSRHYISVNNILRTLDAMAMNKMNVFHWHIVDDQSFPYQSEKFPDLSRYGAYHHKLVYTKADIDMIVNYAKQRGIRVLPEFDVPGHTSSWGVAYPNILTKCYNAKGQFMGLGPMDPTKNVTYKLLQDLFQEVQQWFPEKYFHVGGDEVELDCWLSNSEIMEFMREHNLTKITQLHALFMQEVIPLLGENTKPIVWQEVFDEDVLLPNDTLIQVWKGNEISEMINILDAGHKLLFSTAWYLDHLKTGGDWDDFYMADPRQMVSKYRSPTRVNLENIVGGEACMWGEVVNDANVISRVWPRASAVAEKLWSPEVNQGRLFYYFYRHPVPIEVYSRLEEHTCRMNRRGIQAQPPSGPGFCVSAL